MKVIVVGAGQVGFHLAKRLSEENQDVMLVESDPDRADFASEHLDVLTVVGNGASLSTLEAAGVKGARMLLAVTSRDEVNLIACLAAKRLGVEYTMARISNPEYYQRGSVLSREQMGIDLIVNPERECAWETYQLLQSAAATDVAQFAEGRVQLIGLRVKKGAPVLGKTLEELGQEFREFHYITAAIVRNEDTFVPKGGDVILEGDQIYNGAVDNASGIAGLLEIAEAFAGLEQRPRRSVTFIAVAAEEQGLLGSAFYGENPVIPLTKTVAGLNIDGLNYFGPTKEIMVVGKGLSELEELLAAAAEKQGRATLPEGEPEKGYYFRSDHFELAKHGVPMLYSDPGSDVVGKGIEWGQAQKAKYTAERYHKPADEYNEGWILSGAVLDVQLYYLVGEMVATGSHWPNWYEGTEFRAIRDNSLKSSE